MTGICIKQWSALEEVGIMLNFDKCIIKTKCCRFFSHLYTPEGVRPNLKKVEAIKQVQPSINKQQMNLFLGTLTYLSGYLANISDLISHLRGLLKSYALFWRLRHIM